MIEVRVPSTQSTDGVRIEVFASLLANYGRKLHTVDAGSTFQIPHGKAHAHGNEDRLLPIAGEIWLAYQTADQRVEYRRLVPGHQYVIPPHIPHQVEIRGGVLESLFPTVVYELKIPIREFAGGFF
ncbi:MAG TPA: hypothetical protein VFA78_06515 [Chloroflexota bacterium]|nr:hypothetical protein [Chloroflexota bacterium]